MQIQEPIEAITLQQVNRVTVRSFNEIQIQPTQINSMFFSSIDNNLYVSREKSSEVYHIVKTTHGEIQFIHLARLPWSKYIVSMDKKTFLFCPFELRVRQYGAWTVHAFTTELLSIKVDEKNSTIHSFHEQQTLQWTVSDDDVVINHLNKTKAPFHITKDNKIQGLGKKINAPSKCLFTCMQSKFNCYLIVGDDSGTLHVYDYKTLGHLKTFKRHAGPILTIKIDNQTDTVYFTGADSKVSAIKLVNNDWMLSGQVRGQSHDIYSLQLIGQTLVSGGLTTDFCCYPIHQELQVLQSHYNRISYSAQKVADSNKSLVLINKLTSFQLWKCNEKTSQLTFLLRYQLPVQKFIKDIKLSKHFPQDSSNLIIASTEMDTVGWKFTELQGITKLFTIKNSYDFIEFLQGKNIFVGLRDTGDIQKVFCKTGKIQEIVMAGVQMPTQMILLSDQKLLVSSNLTQVVKVFDLQKRALISTHNLAKVYQTICEKSDTQYLIKYADDNNLYSCDFSKKLVQQTAVYSFAQNLLIRYSGAIVHRSPKTKCTKKYWFFAAESKLYLINNLNNSKDKRSRAIFTRQIATVLKAKTTKFFQIGPVHLNFKRMLDNMEIKPLIVKRII